MLLDSNDIKMLSGVKICIRSKISGKQIMDFASIDTGGNQEFTDYQQFTPGENIRHIDWNRYMRDSTLFYRQYQKPEKPEITVVPDFSSSIVAANKIQAVKCLSAALCFCILNKGVKVKLFLDGNFRTYSGQGGWLQLHNDLDILSEISTAPIALKPVVAGISRSVVVVSDMIYSDGFGQFKNSINIGDKMAFLIAVSNQNDRQPTLDGNYKLVDSQNGKELHCYINKSMIDKYQRSRENYYRQIEKYCKTMNWQYKEVDAEDDIVKQFLKLTQNGILYI
jgi:uncharacterized protein (DUF58 family)